MTRKRETDKGDPMNQLPEEREFVRAIFSSLGDHVGVIDKAGTIVAVNEAWTRFAAENGLDTVAAIGVGVNYLEVCHKAIKDGDETAQAALGGIESVLAGRDERFDLEYPCHAPSAERWFRMRVIPLRGDAEGAVITHSDITEIRKAREDLEVAVNERTAELIQSLEKLKEAEVQYRTVADFTYDWEYWEKPDGSLQYISPSCERITGYDAKSFLADPRWIERVILPEDHPVWKAHNHLRRERRPSQPIQFRIRRKNGDVRWVEHVCQRVVDENGKFLGFRSSNRDITERKQSEESLRRKEHELTEAQRIAHLGSWDWDIVTNTLTWSDEVYRIFGLRPQEFGATYDAFLNSVHPDDRDSVKEAVNRSLANREEHYSIEHRVVRSDGKQRLVHERGKVYRNERGEPIRMLGTVHDITERKKVEEDLRVLREQLSHLNRVAMMGELAASLAHELNQPLSAILSNAYAASRFLGQHPPDLGEVRGAVSDIAKDGERASEVIRRLRNFFRKGEPHRASLNLNDTVQEVIRLLRSEILARRIVVSSDLADDLPPLLGDRIQIQQVMLNLLLNGMDALEESATARPELVVRTSCVERDWVEFSVQDSGPGIPTDKLESIFEPFVTMKPHGVGMGLSISRSIVKAHGGRLWATNNPEGGATLHFVLPLVGEGASS